MTSGKKPEIFSTRIIILNNHQFTITTEILPGVLTWPAKVELQYSHDYAGITAGIRLAENSLLNFSVVTGNSLLSIGADLSFIPATRQLDNYNAGLSFNIAILNASLTLNDMGDKLRASCYSSISPLTKTAIAVELDHQFSRNESTLTFGAQHAIFPVTLVKARASSNGKLGALIQQQLFPSFFLTIAGDVDTQHSVNSVTTISKLGMSLAFRP
ncbi:mitochondrial outer membrane protein porin of 36 kDa-like isoform X2 [Rhododendron vialii]|uniref:mitochondrial outer membrane protein porin of 36 kDa-like isoform X2 n=1 Tax=Rhododendron vialii TaxID=182163 RepID=UPI00265E119B|nr:mitochondrial outer membrane protein porin of 36 kDa-like isoform X2 [Rhododendron vialii]